MVSVTIDKEAMCNYRDTTVLQDLGLRGKVIVVTGGASGIGLALSRAVLEMGGSVAAVGFQPEPNAEFSELLDATQKSAQCRYYCADVADAAALGIVFHDIISDLGRVDGIITCAGICVEKPFVDTSYEEVLRLCQSIGAFMSIQHAVKAMLSNQATANLPSRGSILMVGSIATDTKCDAQNLSAYSASKGGCKGLLAGLAVELAPLGIRVNMLSPGHTVTDMSVSQFATRPELETIMTSSVPMGRMGHRRDMKAAAVYFLSDSSLYTTGSELVVSGGLHAGRV